MRAIDTNIVIRLIVRDEPGQLAIAENFMQMPYMLLPTVIMEVIWVLESRYRLAPKDVAERLAPLLGNRHAFIVSVGSVEWALAQYAQGADFADALHLALAAEVQATAFTTFDKGLSKISTPPIPIETLA